MSEIIKEITIVWYEKYGYHTFTGAEENVRKYIEETWPESNVDAIIAKAKERIEVIV